MKRESSGPISISVMLEEYVANIARPRAKERHCVRESQSQRRQSADFALADPATAQDDSDQGNRTYSKFRIR